MMSERLGDLLLDEAIVEEGDRGLPSVNDKPPMSPVRKGMLVLFMLFSVTLIVAVLYATVIRKTTETKKASEDQVMRTSTGARQFKADELPDSLPVLSDAREAEMEPLPPLPDEMESMPPVVDPSASPMMFSGGAAATPVGRAAAAMPMGGADDGALTAGGGALGDMLSGTVAKQATARMLPDRNFLITKGNMIECGLQSKLDSTVSGMVTCNTTKNVFSASGRVLLIERGSRIVGEYRGGGNIKQGQDRLFVLWTRIETPNGVIIDLDSPGTDALGGAGVPGYVDTHFWKRFGNALLLSIIETGLEIAEERARRMTGTGDEISMGSSGDSSDMATEALRNSINIPPTLYVLNGNRLNVFVARDLDLSAVYGLALEW